MKRFLPIAIVGMLLLWVVRAEAVSTGEATTSLLTEAPTESAEVGSYRPGEKTGLRWYWTAEGRRDLGQVFRVEKSFAAERLVLQINSGSAKSVPEASFKLTFARVKTNGVTPGEAVAVRTGKLPKETLRAGTWLSISFEPVSLPSGVYCFLLQFVEEREGQAVILNVGKPDVYEGGKGIQSLAKDPSTYSAGSTLNFFLFKSGDRSTTAAPAVSPRTSEGRVLEVNRNGGTSYRTIVAAIKDVHPGDTIRLATGSGPYREIVHIPRSGEPGRPIVFDGNGEVVTGFEPLVFKKEGDHWVSDLTAFFASLKYVQGFEKKDGMWVNSAQPLAFPSVVTYRGKRVFQEAGTGNFEKLATVADGGRKIILADGVSPEGWEIAARDAAFRILNVSHQLYRNTRASGSLNDGYNLHGSGTDLVFENCEGFQNLDEGFSAHDTIQCVVRNGRFWENENGLCNVETSVMTASDIQTFSNSGWGFGLRRAQGTLERVHSWNNGVAQIVFLPGSTVTCHDVVAGQSSPGAPRWITAQESKLATAVAVYEKSPEASVNGEVTIEQSSASTSMLSK